MPDPFSPEERSRIMSRIKGQDTAPEKLVRSILHGLGYRYRLHVKELPGKPDIVFPGRKKVIFIHGCYWHAHSGCSRASMPSTNQEFWETKISKNVERDRRNLEALKESGWQPLVVWQCELKAKNREALIDSLVTFLEK